MANDDSPAPPAADVHTFHQGCRVRVDAPRPDYEHRGSPLPLANRGTVLARDPDLPALTWTDEGKLIRNDAVDPAAIRYTVRLDTGVVLDAVGPDRLAYAAADLVDDDASRRLRDRYAREPRYGFASPDLIAEVFHNERRRLHPEDYTGPPEVEPTDEDLLDALACLADARSDLDLYERYLLDCARERGITWETIGLTLGYKPERARAGAQDRRSRLKRKRPTRW